MGRMVPSGLTSRSTGLPTPASGASTHGGLNTDIDSEAIQSDPVPVPLKRTPPDNDHPESVELPQRGLRRPNSRTRMPPPAPVPFPPKPLIRSRSSEGLNAAASEGTRRKSKAPMSYYSGKERRSRPGSYYADFQTGFGGLKRELVEISTHSGTPPMFRVAGDSPDRSGHPSIEDRPPRPTELSGDSSDEMLAPRSAGRAPKDRFLRSASRNPRSQFHIVDPRKSKDRSFWGACDACNKGKKYNSHAEAMSHLQYRHHEVFENQKAPVARYIAPAPPFGLPRRLRANTFVEQASVSGELNMEEVGSSEMEKRGAVATPTLESARDSKPNEPEEDAVESHVDEAKYQAALRYQNQISGSDQVPLTAEMLHQIAVKGGRGYYSTHSNSGSSAKANSDASSDVTNNVQSSDRIVHNDPSKRPAQKLDIGPGGYDYILNEARLKNRELREAEKLRKAHGRPGEAISGYESGPEARMTHNASHGLDEDVAASNSDLQGDLPQRRAQLLSDSRTVSHDPRETSSTDVGNLLQAERESLTRLKGAPRRFEPPSVRLVEGNSEQDDYWDDSDVEPFTYYDGPADPFADYDPSQDTSLDDAVAEEMFRRQKCREDNDGGTDGSVSSTGENSDSAFDGPHPSLGTTAVLDGSRFKEPRGREELGAFEEDQNGASDDSDTDGDLDDIFDTESLMSLESALTSSSGYEDVAAAAMAVFVELFCEKLDLAALAESQEDQGTLDVLTLKNGIRRLLKILSRDLANEGLNSQHRSLSSFFMSSSRALASSIMRRAGLEVRIDFEEQRSEASEPKEQGEKDALLSDDESDMSEEEAPEPEAAPDINALRSAVAASRAFGLFLSSVRELVCPTFVHALKRMSRHASGKSDSRKIDGHLQEVLSELIYANPATIEISEMADCTWQDRIKGYVEDKTEEAWDWWPLKPRQGRLESGQTRLKWECRCGDTRTADLRKAYAQRIIRARQQTSHQPSATRQSSGTSATLTSTASGGAITNGCGPVQGSSSNPVKGLSTSTQTQGATVIRMPSSSRFIPFMMPCGALSLAEIESQNLCNARLFERMRTEYKAHKGTVARFRTMRFAHCEFFKFEEWATRRYCERSPGIPPDADEQYYYAPRPMDREPPLSKHEFHDRFYDRIPNEDRYDCDAVDRIPQIKQRVSLPRKRQQFYGIVAREKKSALVMASYIMACSVPGVIFFFLWVFQWGHESLQDASILLLLSWTLLGLLYAAQFLH